MFKIPYLLLKERLATMPDPDHAGQNYLKEVTWYNNQYAPTEDEPVLGDPAVYIEFLPVSTGSPASRGARQRGNLTVRLHTVTSNNAPTDADALRHLDVVARVWNRLRGYAGKLSDLPEHVELKGTNNDLAVFSSLTRTGINPDHTQTGLIITVQEFTTFAHDTDLHPLEPIKMHPKPAVTGNLD